MTTTAHGAPDTDHLSAPRSRRRVTFLVLGILVGLLVGGMAGAFWPQDGGRTVVKIRGSAVLETSQGGHGGALTELEGDRREMRGANYKGKISVTLPDRRLITGVLTTTLNAHFVRTSTGPSEAHAWGTAKAVLAGTTCKGSYGFSHYYDPREVGGSLNLRCADGSVLGGKYYLVKSEVVKSSIYREHYRLTDGFDLPPA